MSEDSDIYIVCSRCYVKISGPTQEAVNTAFRGHEKEAHGYMTGQEFYKRFAFEIGMADKLADPDTDMMDLNEIDKAARKAAGLEASND